MSETIRNLGQNAWLWRAILFKGFNGWFIVFIMALFSQDVDWAGMTTFQKIRWLAMGLIAGGKYLEGFIDQDLGRTRTQIQQALGFKTDFIPNPEQKTDTKAQ